MPKRITISVDAMGGANAPSCVVNALEQFCEEVADVQFLMFGEEGSVRRLLNNTKLLKNRSTFIPSKTIIRDDEQPIKALKTGKESSMTMAVNAVKDGRADACISGGNTGALMVISKLTLGSIRGIKRPAIVNVFPSLKKGTVVLDLGANSDCDHMNLFQFALMGTCFATVVLGVKSPSIGILNVGTEEYKGRDVEKKTYDLLKKSSLNFYGHVEGYDLTNGTVDVLVTDGFTGNIAIKVSEGTAKICQEFIREAFNSTWLSKIAGLITKSNFKRVMKKVDPRNYNGAMFIGLEGVVVKSHGSSDDYGFNNALHVTYHLVKKDINKQIKDLLSSVEVKAKPESLVSKIKSKLGF
jgi:phosphate acyltransferase